MKHGKAAFSIITAGILWGIIGIFTRQMSAYNMTSAQITFLRCLITFVCVFAFVVIFDRKALKIKIKDIWMFLGTGIASIVLFNIFYFTTINTTTLSVAAMLLYLAPCFVMLLSAVIFKEKITKYKVFSLVFAGVGCAFITGVFTGGSVSFESLLTGILSGFCYALYSIFGKFALAKYSIKTVIVYTFLFATLALLPFISVHTVMPLAFSQTEITLNVLGIGILSTALPYLFYTYGLRFTDAGRASIFAFVEPMVATLVGLIAFSEHIDVLGIVGIILIFMSVFILTKKTK